MLGLSGMPGAARAHPVRRPAAAAGDRPGAHAPAPACCSSTSRPRAWTRRAGATCGPTCARPRASVGTTVFLTTHYLEEAEAADAVCVLAGGRIIERGSPAEVKERQLSPELVLDAPTGQAAPELESWASRSAARQEP